MDFQVCQTYFQHQNVVVVALHAAGYTPRNSLPRQGN